jgi:hypothetical protein
MLASSRLASHSPVIPQVYTAPDAHLSRGDFGVKRSLPSRGKVVGTLRYIDVDAIDTREGQTSWTEREHEVLIARRFRELNIKLDGPVKKSDVLENRRASVSDGARGLLGPRFTTRYDPSTRRPIPTTYEAVPDAKLRAHLQAEAQLGRGPMYKDNMFAGEAVSSGTDGNGPFGTAANYYTHTIALPVDYSRMDEKTFESFLEYVRAKRPEFQQQAAARALAAERQILVKRYNDEQHSMMLAAREHATEEEREAARNAIPPPVTEQDIPLPGVARSDAAQGDDTPSVTSDMWDGSRDGSLVDSVWKSWLRRLDEKRAASPESKHLPHAPASSAGQLSSSMHPQGGLQYGQPDYIQHQRLADGVSARQLERAQDNDTRQTSLQTRKASRSINSGRGSNVAVAGHVAFLPMSMGSAENREHIDWSQNDSEQGVVTVKAITAQRLLADSITPTSTWGGLSDKEMNKSASASHIVNKAASNANSNDSTFDALRKNQLPSQYGVLDMRVHAVQQNSLNNLARGKPGSREWVGSIDGRLGYRSGMHEDAPLDFTSADYSKILGEITAQPLSPLQDGRRRTGPSSVARGVGAGMYSNKEQRQAAEHVRRKRGDSRSSQPRMTSRMHVEELIRERRSPAQRPDSRTHAIPSDETKSKQSM